MQPGGLAVVQPEGQVTLVQLCVPEQARSQAQEVEQSTEAQVLLAQETEHAPGPQLSDWQDPTPWHSTEHLAEPRQLSFPWQVPPADGWPQRRAQLPVVQLTPEAQASVPRQSTVQLVAEPQPTTPTHIAP